MSTALQAPVAEDLPQARPKTSSGYIIGPVGDWLLIVGSPLLSVVLAALVAMDPYSMLRAIIVISPAHLFLVLYRSHGNANVFRRFPIRFTLVPLLFFAAIFFSEKIFAFAFIVTILWDQHHGYMQNFGICRIYDAKAGNDPNLGRGLDMVLNFVIDIGPLICGVWLLRYVKEVSNFSLFETFFFSRTVPAFVDTNHSRMAWWVVGLSAVFFVFYFWKQRQYAKQGYRMPWQKAAFLVSTAVTYVFAWVFNPFGMGFFITNIFHAVQYFGLVYWSERKQLQGRLGLAQSPRGPAVVLVFVLLPAILFGIVSLSIPRNTPHVASIAYIVLCAALVLECMHFWWDGFIWSVRKKEVQQLVQQ